jgi:hypothetical protein
MLTGVPRSSLYVCFILVFSLSTSVLRNHQVCARGPDRSVGVDHVAAAPGPCYSKTRSPMLPQSTHPRWLEHNVSKQSRSDDRLAFITSCIECLKILSKLFRLVEYVMLSFSSFPFITSWIQFNSFHFILFIALFFRNLTYISTNTLCCRILSVPLRSLALRSLSLPLDLRQHLPKICLCRLEIL